MSYIELKFHFFGEPYSYKEHDIYTHLCVFILVFVKMTKCHLLITKCPDCGQPL